MQRLWQNVYPIWYLLCVSFCGTFLFPQRREIWLATTIMEAGDGGETDTKYCGQDKEIRAGFGWGDIGYALLSCPIGHSIQAMRSFKGHTACAGWKNGVWQVAALWLPERGEKLPDTSFSSNAKLYFVYTLRRILI